MKKRKNIGLVSVRSDGMTGLLRAQDRDNLLNLKVARGRLTLPKFRKKRR